jgi:hypothetical protein
MRERERCPRAGGRRKGYSRTLLKLHNYGSEKIFRGDPDFANMGFGQTWYMACCDLSGVGASRSSSPEKSAPRDIRSWYDPDLLAPWALARRMSRSRPVDPS